MKLAIFSATNFAETFTQAHRDFLQPAYRLSGFPIPTHCNGRSFHHNGMVGKATNRLFHVLSGSGLSYEEYVSFRNLKRIRPEVMLVEFGTFGSNVLPIARKLGIPMVVGFYGYDVSSKRVLDNYLDRYPSLFEYGAAFFTQSNTIRDRLIGWGCDPNKVVVNPCPPHPRFEKMEIKPSGKKLLFVGRFVDKKAPHLLVLAFKQVLEKHPDATLCMAGDGPLLGACQDLAAYYGLDSAVEFPGRIDPSRQIELFHETAIMVQHSVTAQTGDREGIPVALMEASMVGLPVVATAHSGIPEVIQNGETGILVQEHDVTAMANAIVELLDNPEKMQHMGAAGRQYMLANHTMKQHIAKLDQMLRENVN